MMEDFLTAATEAALDAGRLLKDGFQQPLRIKNKGVHDLVTDFDLKSEQLITEHLRSRYPAHSLLSEESGMDEKQNDYCWIIDPLDGTSNFVTGSSYFAVSVALRYKQSIICGVVYCPVTGELFTARYKGGAFLNGKPLKVSRNNELSKSYIAVAWAADEHRISEGINTLKGLAPLCRRIVINFAPALDLCNIARGRLDALIDNGSTPEDHAAASLILTEAGGTIFNLYQPGWDVMQTGIIATNGYIDLRNL